MNCKDELNKAIDFCNGTIPETIFSYIYPFTTENISGYIDYFELKDKSLMTVGSSGDQAINAILYGCSDVTLLDVNPFTKYYYFLKVACLECLNFDEFMSFFRFKDYPKVFKDNIKVFDKDIFERLKSTLKMLDIDSFFFWRKLFATFDAYKIRTRMFSSDEDRTNVISGCNPYLRVKKSYEETKKIITNVVPKFMCGNLFEIEIEQKYDNIWLSNIGTYCSSQKILNMLDKMSTLLNDNGKLLFSYLYKTTKNTEYQDNWSSIYDLEKTFKMLSAYTLDLVSFKGVDGIKFDDDSLEDSALIYHKVIK